MRVLDEMLTPLAAAMAAIPIVALTPIFNTMFASTSSTPRRLVVAIYVFFPIFVNTLRGLRQIDPVHAELMRSYAASPWTTTKVVRLPGALPFFFTGPEDRVLGGGHRRDRLGVLRRAAEGAGPGHHLGRGGVGLPAGLGDRDGRDRARARLLPRRGARRAPGDALATTTRRTLVSRFLHRAAWAAALASCVLAMAACGGDDNSSASTSTAAGGAKSLTKVKLQLQWFTQAQFAGYFAALQKGYYKDAGLDVQILEGGTDIVPQTQLAQGRADYAIAWVPKALQSREQGAGITDVGQVFQRSGTLQVSFKNENITTAANLKGKKVGNWGFGNEFELFAGMTKAGLNPGKDVTLAQQQFDMQALLKGDIDAAQAMIYNEYAQVLEAKNPKTGKLYTPDDFNRIDWNSEGTAMLQDAIWANTEKLKRQGLPGPDGQVPAGELQGLDVLPRQRREVPRHRRRARLEARGEPPAVADERDQQARLALAERHRHGRQDRVGPDGQDRQQHQERRRRHRPHQGARGPGLHQRLRPEGAGRAEGRRRRRRHRDRTSSRSRCKLNPGGA